MGIHAKASNKKVERQRKRPLKIRKEKIQQKRMDRDNRRGFTDFERAASSAMIPHQIRQLRTNPHAAVGLSKKKMRKLAKAQHHAEREAYEKEQHQKTLEELAAEADVVMKRAKPPRSRRSSAADGPGDAKDEEPKAAPMDVA